jgi:hypothetical protein
MLLCLAVGPGGPNGSGDLGCGARMIRDKTSSLDTRRGTEMTTVVASTAR